MSIAATGSRPPALRLGSVNVDAGTSTFAGSPLVIDADSVDETTLTITARNLAGNPLPNKVATIARESIAVSAANSTVTASPGTITNNGTDASVVTLTLRDGSNRPIPGIAAASCVLAVSGSGNTVTQPTGVTNEVGEISGSFVSTGAATKTASFTVLGVAITDTASVVVTGSGGGALDAWWDWRDSTGIGAPAVTDGGKINIAASSGVAEGRIEVIAATGLDFPAGMDNVLEILYGDTFSPLVGRNDNDAAWVTPSIGDSQARRFYIRNDLPTNFNTGGDHGLQTNVGAIQYGHHVEGNIPGTGDGVWYFSVFAEGGWSGSGISTRMYCELDKGVTYRVDYVITREDASTCSFDIAVYDENGATPGTPVATSTDFFMVDAPAQNLSNNVATYSDATNLFRRWLFGSSGQGGADVGGSVYVGGFAVRNGTTPIGAYPTADEV